MSEGQKELVLELFGLLRNDISDLHQIVDVIGKKIDGHLTEADVKESKEHKIGAFLLNASATAVVLGTIYGLIELIKKIA